MFDLVSRCTFTCLGVVLGACKPIVCYTNSPFSDPEDGRSLAESAKAVDSQGFRLLFLSLEIQ